MICVTVTPDGYIQAINPPPATVGECTLILVSPQEVSASWSVLTPEQGAQIGAAIALVWAIAYGVRVISRMSSTTETEKEF